MALMIGGHSRSGTTILQELMHKHPEIAVTKEFGCFAYVGQSRLKYSFSMLLRWYYIRGKWAYDASDETQQHIAWRNLRFTAQHLARLNRQGPISVSNIEATLKRTFPEAAIAGDKWPPYIYMLDKFIQDADAHCMIIYRDCRDVTSSFLKQARTTWKKQAWVNDLNTAEKIAHNWVQVIDLMEHHAEHLHIVRYEDMIANPQAVFTAIGHWLGVDPGGFPTNEIKDTSIGKYRNGLSSEELVTVMTIAGPTMARLGYT